MQKDILIILPLFFLVLILVLPGNDLLYLETTGESISAYYEEQENIQEEGFRTGDTFTVEITANGINPEIIKGKIGVWIEFVNNDSNTHRLITKWGDIDTGDLNHGDSFKKSFGSNGEFIFTDEYNPEIIFELYIGEED